MAAPQEAHLLRMETGSRAFLVHPVHSISIFSSRPEMCAEEAPEGEGHTPVAKQQARVIP